MTSTRVTQSVAVAGLLLIAAPGAYAQSCLGLPDLSVVRRSLSTSASINGADALLLGRVGVSGQKAFVGLQGGYGGTALTTSTATVLGFDAGYVWKPGSGRTQLCPVVQSLYFRGPAYNGRRSENLLNSASLSIGTSFQTTRRLALVPFAQGEVVQRYSLEPYSTTYPEWLFNLTGPKRSSYGSEFGLGVGVRLGDVLTLKPSVTLPVGFSPRIDGSTEAKFSLSASFGFRR